MRPIIDSSKLAQIIAATILVGVLATSAAAQTAICGDLDGSGQAVATDVLLLLQFTVGLPVTPQCPNCSGTTTSTTTSTTAPTTSSTVTSTSTSTTVTSTTVGATTTTTL
jgi:hypothetical protein